MCFLLLRARHRASLRTAATPRGASMVLALFTSQAELQSFSLSPLGLR
jgi:hypothetical protein